jgi:hypothetical protein
MRSSGALENAASLSPIFSGNPSAVSQAAGDRARADHRAATDGRSTRMDKRSSKESKSLDARRLEAQVDRLATWEFAEKFPALGVACLENEKMRKASAAEHPDLTGEGLLNPIRGRWKRKGIPRKDTEALCAEVRGG